ncbi:hypothetical protein AB0D21_32605 [Streptomyces hundungensis]
MSHRNARLAVHGGWNLVERVLAGRPVSHVAAVRALQRMSYFHDDGLWSGLAAVLAAWIIACVALLYLRDTRGARTAWLRTA